MGDFKSAWILKTVKLDIASTTVDIRLTNGEFEPEKGILTPTVIIQASEGNTDDITILGKKDGDDGVTVAKRDTVEMSAPEINGTQEMLDISQIWLSTDTAGNDVQITYFVRPD